MASIKKLSNGWRYRVSYKSNEIGKDGKPIYKTKTLGGFRTKRECELAAAEIEAKYNRGHDINAGEQLFAEYMRNWYEVYQKGKHSLEHDRNIERSVKLVEKHFPGVRLKDLTRDMYQRFLNDFAVDHATATVSKRHIYIRSCIRDAIEDGAIFKDPTAKAVIKGEKEEKSEELKYLNFDEVKNLTAEIQKDMRIKYMSRYFILFAITTGARFSEIAGMTWDCVDFENKAITINKTWDFKDKKDFGDTKNYQSRRTITIDNDMVKLLRELKNEQNKFLLQSGLRNEKNLCFINTKLEIITHNAVNKTLKALCKKIGAQAITTHALRHSHASMLLYRGVNIKYISRRLGHKDIVTTLQTYSHILDEMEQKESRVIDETMADLFATK